MANNLVDDIRGVMTETVISTLNDSQTTSEITEKINNIASSKADIGDIKKAQDLTDSVIAKKIEKCISTIKDRLSAMFEKISNVMDNTKLDEFVKLALEGAAIILREVVGKTFGLEMVATILGITQRAVELFKQNNKRERNTGELALA